MIVALEHARWNGPVDPATAERAVAALEAGAVLHLPALSFEIAPDEQRLFSVGLAKTSKNVSYTPASRRLGGTDAEGADRDLLSGILARFSSTAAMLTSRLFPPYEKALEIARASFRPAEIAGRRTSWRKDDTRLHVDSFPSSPTGGKRIIRVFTNVNPQGRSRSWRVGGAFADVITRYQSRLRRPWPGSGALLKALRVTKTRRTEYDAFMLQIHDLMKQDDDYQLSPLHTTVEFAPGSTWVAFTDQVSHAATAGQYQFEQTILLPVGAMLHPEYSPLRILERAVGRALV